MLFNNYGRDNNAQEVELQDDQEDRIFRTQDIKLAVFLLYHNQRLREVRHSKHSSFDTTFVFGYIPRELFERWRSEDGMETRKVITHYRTLIRECKRIQYTHQASCKAEEAEVES